MVRYEIVGIIVNIEYETELFMWAPILNLNISANMKRFRIFILVSRFKTIHIWKLPKSLQGQWANYSVSFFPSIVLVWIFSKGFLSKINWASWCWDNEEASTRSSQTTNTLLQQPRGMHVPTNASGVYPRLFKNSREETRDTLCHSLLSPASVLSYQQNEPEGFNTSAPSSHTSLLHSQEPSR